MLIAPTFTLSPFAIRETSSYWTGVSPGQFGEMFDIDLVTSIMIQINAAWPDGTLATLIEEKNRSREHRLGREYRDLEKIVLDGVSILELLLLAS
jgi:hypothetical protein